MLNPGSTLILDNACPEMVNDQPARLLDAYNSPMSFALEIGTSFASWYADLIPSFHGAIR
jgi:hypothetical protein